MGVPPADVDDAAQRVFLVLDRKLKTVRQGAEVRFLFQTAFRIASDFRRAHRRQRRSPDGLEGIDPPEPSGDPSDLLELRQRRQRLDQILDAMPMELRAVFVLFELDEMTMADISKTTGLRPGTVASRLRRARAFFSECARNLEEVP
jgi:RNA polymerase sigma-70 factor (ECF subfamily)